MARACVLNSVLIADNGVAGPKWFQAGDSSIYIGYLVEYEDADEVVVMPTTIATEVVGVAGCPSYHDTTAAFTETHRVPVWFRGCGAEVWVTHDGVAGNGTLAVKFGDILTYSNSTAGLAEIDAAYDIDSLGICTRALTVTNGTAVNIRCLLS